MCHFDGEIKIVHVFMLIYHFIIELWDPESLLQ